MLRADGRLIADAALDAIAGAQERITDPDAAVVGIQVTLVIRTDKGLRIVSKRLQRHRTQRTRHSTDG